MFEEANKRGSERVDEKIYILKFLLNIDFFSSSPTQVEANSSIVINQGLIDNFIHFLASYTRATFILFHLNCGNVYHSEQNFLLYWKERRKKNNI